MGFSAILIGPRESRHRATVYSAFLLVLAIGLAVGLSQFQNTRYPLSDFTPPGWHLAFKIPTAFTRTSTPAVPDECDVYTFTYAPSPGRPVSLQLWRCRGLSDRDPGQQAVELLRWSSGFAGAFETLFRRVPLDRGFIGDLPAIEAQLPSGTAVARVAELAGYAEHYAVTMTALPTQAAPAPLDPTSSHFFALVAATASLVEPGP